jgi:REP element-mobilizing transposase RayT
MARKPRVEFDGALYHVIARGNHRRDIFRDDSDRANYLQRIERYRERYQAVVYAYVLMSNHVHLLIEARAVGYRRSCRASSSVTRSTTIGDMVQWVIYSKDATKPFSAIEMLLGGACSIHSI